ncbi:class II aldolase/adducin family protein [Ketobacter sp.]|uniref:class II aldolase/adducin family protein n=1 Tax=Ketobacter sp. TaxID=2083498 RepID=UPI000F21F69E|nr:class II aldolase/adducin family protein [Ketobacter sp.]RLT95347.1 MAG: class II aldolase/adducin family protein [Ketobacter sp.]
MGPQAISNPKEGVIQYQLEFEIDHDIDCPQFASLNGWRSYLHRLGLIGQDPDRYDGLGYGNVSHRAEQDAFVISGTQTGHLPLLCREHYVLVEDTNVQDNYLRARGPIPPSSEALTHAALYLASDAIQAVIHVHSPLLWQRARQLQLATTPEQVSYGTPAMAEAVTRLVAEGEGSEGVIAMLGHEDGIIVYGADVEAAGARLLQAVMDAHQFDEHYFK